MLDIIIPVYKNKRGLQRTLASINTNYLDRIKVTIVFVILTEVRANP